MLLSTANLKRKAWRALHQSTNLSAGRVLVIAEHDCGKLDPSIFNCIGATKYLKNSAVEVLVAGSNLKSISDKIEKIDNVSKVLVRESALYDHATAEPLAKFLVELQKKNCYTHILASSSASSKNFMPRMAALLDIQPITEVLEIKDDNTFVRPIYAGNALVTCKSNQPIQILTIRHSSFEPAIENSAAQAAIELIDDDFGAQNVVRSRWVDTKYSNNEYSDLTSAKVVICGGRGMKDAKSFKKLYELASVFGEDVAVGASRAAVDAGFISNDFQVGQTGKVVAPELYIGVGLSGAIQHLAGIRDSKKIVAINSDPEAPIFKIADYGMVGDHFEILPELIKRLAKQ